jgi:SAM-dependent methyltransferase
MTEREKHRSFRVKSQTDISRLQKEYADRERRFAGRDTYSLFNPANLFTIQSRQRAILKTFHKYHFSQLSELNILEMGCGNGGVLAEYITYGASPEKVFGVDLLFDRLLHARHILPGSSFSNADGSHLPFPSHTFDLVLQYTAISSILDSGLRREICEDMLRVLRPSGLILSYDFWLNPTNPQTRGFGPTEIRSLFPGCRCHFERITLAPPLARILVPISWTLASFLESLRIFNSHYLTVIQPPS